MLNLILKQVQEKRQLTDNFSILTQKMVLLSRWAGPGKTDYGDGAWKTTGNMEEGRPDEVGRISVQGRTRVFLR